MPAVFGDCSLVRSWMISGLPAETVRTRRLTLTGLWYAVCERSVLTVKEGYLHDDLWCLQIGRVGRLVCQWPPFAACARVKKGKGGHPPIISRCWHDKSSQLDSRVVRYGRWPDGISSCRRAAARGDSHTDARLRKNRRLYDAHLHLRNIATRRGFHRHSICIRGEAIRTLFAGCQMAISISIGTILWQWIRRINRGIPVKVLSGLHSGCLELIANRDIGSMQGSKR